MSDHDGSNFSPDAENDQALRSDGTNQSGDGAAFGSNQRNIETWPPPGVAVYETPDARFYLLEQYRLFIDRRDIQKLRTDKGFLDGRRVPKDGGGVKLLITKPSIDKYATSNLVPDRYRVNDEIAAKADDPDLDRLRVFAHNNNLRFVLIGDANSTHATPIETPRNATIDEKKPVDPEKPSVERNADETPELKNETPIETPRNAVDREFLDFLRDEFNELKGKYHSQITETNSLKDTIKSQGEDFKALLDQQAADHSEEKNELLDDLKEAWDGIHKLQDTNSSLKLAFVEAKAKLPPNTTLEHSFDFTANNKRGELPERSEVIHAEVPEKKDPVQGFSNYRTHNHDEFGPSAGQDHA